MSSTPAYRCACGDKFWNKNEFRQHFTICPEGQEFIKETRKIIKEYERLQKHLENPEEYT